MLTAQASQATWRSSLWTPPACEQPLLSQCSRTQLRLLRHPGAAVGGRRRPVSCRCGRRRPSSCTRGRVRPLSHPCGHLRPVSSPCGRLWPLRHPCGHLRPGSRSCGRHSRLTVDLSVNVTSLSREAGAARRAAATMQLYVSGRAAATMQLYVSSRAAVTMQLCVSGRRRGALLHAVSICCMPGSAEVCHYSLSFSLGLCRL